MLDTLINFEVHCYRDNVTINCQLNVTKLGRWLIRLVSIILCLIVITFASIIDPVWLCYLSAFGTILTVLQCGVQ